MQFFDAVVVIWVATWIVVGFMVGREVASLTRFGDTLLMSADALEETAGGLDSLSGVPLVGGRIEDIADRIDEAAGSVRSNAEAATEKVNQLSILLGSAIAVIPSLPVLGLYLPRRYRRWQERRHVLRALDDRPGRDGVNRLLAHRALVHLPYRQLMELTKSPWKDFEEGRFEPLVRAELRRLGIDRDRMTRASDRKQG